MKILVPDREPISWQPTVNLPGFNSIGVHLGRGNPALEVVIFTAAKKPTAGELKRIWFDRRRRRASPVMLVVTYVGQEGDALAALCGPIGTDPWIQRDVELSLAGRMAENALAEPNHHAATRYLSYVIPQSISRFPGVRNVGLFATRELEYGVQRRGDWQSACRKSVPLVGLRGRKLAESLGFKVEPLERNSSLLTAPQSAGPDGYVRRAVAVFCDADEPFDSPAERFGATPASHAQTVATRHGLKWVILTRSAEIRLYAATTGVGVGSRGLTETYVELNLGLLPESNAGYLDLLFSAGALDEDGSVASILSQSERFASGLADRLRIRVYEKAVPALARAMARYAPDSPGREELDGIYEQVMVAVFRLLFVAYAEDRDLLPYRTNERYQIQSLTMRAQLLAKDLEKSKMNFDVTSDDLWMDVNQIWRAVNEGNTDWGVPAYDGGLFSSDPEINPAGAAIARMRLTNAEFGPALSELLVDHGPEGFGPVDFRSLSAREFGTVYEGLLESQLSLALENMCVEQKGKHKGIFRPAREGDEVEVEAGTIYFHNHSGFRKSSGTYFTKPFAVAHLLDHALEPALDDHITRLEEHRERGDELSVADAFFDFRCADIAMGSGHFLVAAVDRIEARLSVYLAQHSIASINNELGRLRSTAYAALGDLGHGVEIETGALLRRQVARYCIYGVDVNQMAVDLARVAVWIHTFVPGLPLSFLDRNLVCGNSLTGVATLDDVKATFAIDKSGADRFPLMSRAISEELTKAKPALDRLAHTSDSTRAEIEAARDAHAEAQLAVHPVRNVFDLVTACRAGACKPPVTIEKNIVAAQRNLPAVEAAIETHLPLHFPTSFPEVFQRSERSGFDCLIGNPPWEKVHVNREIWWGSHLPGVRAIPVAGRRARINQMESERPDLKAQFEADRRTVSAYKALIRAAFRSLGSGHTDLYKAFAWANLNLCREGGRVGLVLPRSAMSDAGMNNWRTRVTAPESEKNAELFVSSDDQQVQQVSLTQASQQPRSGSRSNKAIISVVTCLNTGSWAFDGIDARYTVALVALKRPYRGTTYGGEYDPQATKRLLAIYPGPTTSLTHFNEIIGDGPEIVPAREFNSWSDTAAFPQIPNRPAFRVWRKMKRHPRFDGANLPSFGAAKRNWRFRPIQELNATTDRPKFLNDGGAAARKQRQ